jgi:hypothetical protein
MKFHEYKLLKRTKTEFKSFRTLKTINEFLAYKFIQNSTILLMLLMLRIV